MKISRAIRKTGFTLIELLVVISIIGLLSSVVLTSLASVRVRARQAVRMQDLRNINNAIQAFYQIHGYYPGSCGWNGFYSAFGGTGWNGSTPREYVRGGSPSVCQGASNQGPYTNWIPELVSSGLFPTLPREPLRKTAGDQEQYLYNSNGGQGYKLIIHSIANDGACVGVPTHMIDPARDGGTSATTFDGPSPTTSCWAYGFWTSDYAGN